jgi:hypothetical protein
MQFLSGISDGVAGGMSRNFRYLPFLHCVRIRRRLNL